MIYAYRNLRRGDWSLARNGVVVARTTEARCENVELRVRPGGRDAARRNGRKNVHAFAISDHFGAFLPPPDHAFRVRYDPRRDDSFVDDAGRPVHFAGRAWLTADGKLYATID